ncbi:hypothetical protein ES708_10333 [subsurface metagenome]
MFFTSSSVTPVLKSMTVSAPYFTAILAFSNSSLISHTRLLEPMLALIFTSKPSPMPIGSISRLLDFGTIIRPFAIPFRTNSTSTCSFLATNSISLVILPSRAIFINVDKFSNLLVCDYSSTND